MFVAAPVAAKGKLAQTPIQKAVALLPEDVQATMPAISLVTEQARDGKVPMAYVIDSDPLRTIHVNTATDVYQAAAQGNRQGLILLASILAHEHAHATRKASEDEAYDVQIAILKALKAQRIAIQAVEAAKAVVLQEASEAVRQTIVILPVRYTPISPEAK